MPAAIACTTGATSPTSRTSATVVSGARRLLASRRIPARRAAPCAGHRWSTRWRSQRHQPDSSPTHEQHSPTTDPTVFACRDQGRTAHRHSGLDRVSRRQGRWHARDSWPDAFEKAISRPRPAERSTAWDSLERSSPSSGATARMVRLHPPDDLPDVQFGSRRGEDRRALERFTLEIAPLV